LQKPCLSDLRSQRALNGPAVQEGIRDSFSVKTDSKILNQQIFSGCYLPSFGSIRNCFT